jgi:hypothetical protein
MIEVQAANAREKATLEGLAQRSTMAASGLLAPPERLMLAAHKLREAVTSKHIPAAAAAASKIIRDEELSLLPVPAAAVVRQAQSLAEQLELAGDLSAGLDLAPGITMLLKRLDTYLSVLQKQQDGHVGNEAGKGEEAAGSENISLPVSDAAEEEQNQGAESCLLVKTIEQPSLDLGKVAEARQLINELLSQGLVILELPNASYKKLRLLRETVESLPDGAIGNGGGIAWSKGMTALKVLYKSTGRWHSIRRQES